VKINCYIAVEMRIAARAIRKEVDQKYEIRVSWCRYHVRHSVVHLKPSERLRTSARLCLEGNDFSETGHTNAFLPM